MGKILSDKTADQLVRLLNDMGRGVQHRMNDPRDLAASDSNNLMTFRVTVEGNVASITTGTIWFSDTSFDLSAGTVTLTGATEYVYAYLQKNHTANGFAHSTSKPLSLGDKWIFPLVYCEGYAGIYMVKKVLHQGDLFMFSPLK
jgi:hypothetical protein